MAGCVFPRDGERASVTEKVLWKANTGPFSAVCGPVQCAQKATKALQVFLDRWPDNPQAPAARLSLVEIKNYLAKSP